MVKAIQRKNFSDTRYLLRSWCVVLLCLTGTMFGEESVEPSSVLVKSRQHLSEGRSREAIALLDLFLAKNDRSPEAVQVAKLLGEVYMEKGDTAKAREAFDYAVKLAKYLGAQPEVLESARQGLLQANRIPRIEPDATYADADSNLSRGKTEDALPMYEKVYKEYSHHELAHPSGYKIGLCLIKMGKSADAERHWSAFVETGSARP